MIKEFCKKLENAQGRSEFVISVVCDIRGFSSFSTCHESPDTAMFIKRFYLKLLNDYFPQAVFAKPTGDGLLLIFRYDETNLLIVSEGVIKACFEALNDFPTMFKDDHMINFSTPSDIGFGISRGPSCCLYSGHTIIDYSGQLLNLASRLNDLARPKGIVLAGSYLKEVIPKTSRELFQENNVYLRGVAEDKPIVIFHSADVSIPDYALHPIARPNWTIFTREVTFQNLKNMDGNFMLNLPDEPESKKFSKLEFRYPSSAMMGYLSFFELDNYKIINDAKGSHFIFKAKDVIAKIIKDNDYAPDMNISPLCAKNK